MIATSTGSAPANKGHCDIMRAASASTGPNMAARRARASRMGWQGRGVAAGRRPSGGVHAKACRRLQRCSGWWPAASAAAVAALAPDVAGDAGSEVGQRLVRKGVEGDRGRPELEPVLRPGGCPGREAGEVAGAGAGRPLTRTTSRSMRSRRDHQPLERSALTRVVEGLLMPMPSRVTTWERRCWLTGAPRGRRRGRQ